MNIKYLSFIALVACCLAGCGSTSEVLLNPYGDEGPQLGDADNAAILDEVGGGTSDHEAARTALKAFGEKQRAIEPQPMAPVIRPAVVRLMWVPDHLNPLGDLVPAHYYYLKVKDDEWELKDGFDNLQQLRDAGVGTGGGSTPWIYSN